MNLRSIAEFLRSDKEEPRDERVAGVATAFCLGNFGPKSWMCGGARSKATTCARNLGTSGWAELRPASHPTRRLGFRRLGLCIDQGKGQGDMWEEGPLRE